MTSRVRRTRRLLAHLALALGPPPRSSAAVLVLGMHRSGTSALTRIVNLLGVPVGRDDDLVPADPANASGYWESLSLAVFQDRLLERLGGSWDAPPPLPRGWERSGCLLVEVGRGRRIVRHAYAGLPVWAWKDPRTALTLPFWQRALSVRMLVLAIHRHPLEVWRSLAARDAFSKERALALWERYNRDLLTNASGLPALVLGYDDLVARPLAVAGRARTFLAAQGIAVGAVPGDAVREFVDTGLRHSVFDESSLESDPEVTPEQRRLALVLRSLEGIHESLDPPSIGEASDRPVRDRARSFDRPTATGVSEGWEAAGR